jgi:protein TonB
MASIFDDSWINLVFQGRNQEYGAFDLRKKTPKNSLIAGLISVSVFVLAVASPFIISLVEGNLNKKAVKVVEINELMAPPPIDPSTPPPPPVEPPPPLKTTIKFTPPVIKKDEEVKDEDVPPPQEELKDKDSGLKNEKGDSSKGVDMSLLDTKGNDVIDDQSDKVFTVVEQMPDFPGGQE